jgi:hypothetical protein
MAIVSLTNTPPLSRCYSNDIPHRLIALHLRWSHGRSRKDCVVLLCHMVINQLASWVLRSVSLYNIVVTSTVQIDMRFQPHIGIMRAFSAVQNVFQDHSRGVTFECIFLDHATHVCWSRNRSIVQYVWTLQSLFCCRTQCGRGETKLKVAGQADSKR